MAVVAECTEDVIYKTVQGSACRQTFSKPELLEFKKSYSLMNVAFSNTFKKAIKSVADSWKHNTCHILYTQI
jgi:hypothetical protein